MIDKLVLQPLKLLAESSVSDITTSIGSFVIKTIRDKLARSISFTVSGYSDDWMEEALYDILYRYNNIKSKASLDLQSTYFDQEKSIYYRLGDGVHLLKYRGYDIFLHIETARADAAGRKILRRTYMLYTFALDDNFVKLFETDFMRSRSSILRIKPSSPTLSVFKDSHESDGYTYWERMAPITRRSLKTIYLEREQKSTLIKSINRFFAEKPVYKKYGMPHNLKILLHGKPGPQPDSTIIPTPNGMRRLGSLEPGEMVFDRLGNPTEILEVIPQGVQPIYEIEFSDGRIARCTLDHPWNITAIPNDGEEKCMLWQHDSNNWKMPENTMTLAKLHIDFTKRNKTHRFYTPQNGPCQFTASSVMGSAASRRAILQDLLHEHGLLLNVINRTLIQIATPSSGPAIYDLLAPGHIDPEVDIVSLVNSLGYYIEKGRGGKYTIIAPINPDGSLAINWDNCAWRPIAYIKDIRKAGYEEPVRCLRVGNPEHLYQTEGYITTHNSGKDSIARAIATEWNRNVYYVHGGRNGRFIPDALTSIQPRQPLFLISDIDKYPFLINESAPETFSAAPRKKIEEEGEDKKPNSNGEENISFGRMINALDGLMSGEDKIIIMTTNHIERFSPTFIRPGRIDINLEISYPNEQVFRKFVYDYYGHILPEDIKLKNYEGTIGAMQADSVLLKMPLEEFLKKYLK